MSYKPWMRFLADLAEGLGFQVEITSLPISGRSGVLVGIPGNDDSPENLGKPGI